MLPQLLDKEAVRVSAYPLQPLADVLAQIPGATAFAFHLNCTKTGFFPSCRAELIALLKQHGLAVLNESVTDISKRFLQHACRRLGLPSVATERNSCPVECPFEEVFVKTDLNYGGKAESMLSSAELQAMHITLHPSPIQRFNEYKVLRREDVPDEWWDHPALVIERYIDNRHNRKHRVYFAGDRYAVSVTIDTQKIKKFRPENSNQEYLSDEATFTLAANTQLPASLQLDIVRLLRHLKIDFGAVDFVEDDTGQCYVIDLNATSYSKALSPDAVQHLRRGLFARIDALRVPGD